LASALAVDDVIVVRAGEVVAVDAIVVDGTSSLGVQHLTGEAAPIRVGPGMQALSGSICLDGALLLRVKRPAAESTVQRLSALASSASASRPPVVTFLDALSTRWSYFVLVSTAALAFLPPLFGLLDGKTALYKSLLWLTTASPCALAISTPLVYLSALSVAASRGVLIKGAKTLDALALSTAVAVDKTGTLTTGQPEVVGIKSFGKLPEATMLQVAGALGRLSSHPVSQALSQVASHLDGVSVSNHEMQAGSGVTADVRIHGVPGAWRAALGRPSFVEEALTKFKPSLGTSGPSILKEMSRSSSAGQLTTALGLIPLQGEGSSERTPEFSIFLLEDRPKTSAENVVKVLSARGPLFMLTGDNEGNARNLASKIGWPGFSTTNSSNTLSSYSPASSSASSTTARTTATSATSPSPSSPGPSSSSSSSSSSKQQQQEPSSASSSSSSSSKSASSSSFKQHQESSVSSLDTIFADLRPEDKLAKIRALKDQLRHGAADKTGANWLRTRWRQFWGVSDGGLVMIGDGINDQPALAAASAGVALASGLDGALSASGMSGSDVVILPQASSKEGTQDLERAAWVLQLATAAQRLLTFNVTLAVLSMVVASTLSLTTEMPLWLGVVLHEGTTVLVALNSLRLLAFKVPK